MAVSDTVKAFIFCSLLALQFGLQPLISSRCTAGTVMKASIVAVTEFEKILIAVVILATSPAAVKEKLFETWTILDSIKVAALPACLYTIQNILIQHSYDMIDSMTFNLLNQTKVCDNSINFFSYFKY